MKTKMCNKIVYLVLLFVLFIFSSIQQLRAYCGPSFYNKRFSISTGFENKYERFLLKASAQKETYFGFNLFGNCGGPFCFLAPDVTYLFPNNGVSGLDVNLNVNIHYYYSFLNQGVFIAYPQIGLGMVNDRFSIDNKTSFKSDFGLNLGLGIEFVPRKSWSANVEFKNMFLFNSSNRMYFSVGIMYRFEMWYR